MTYDPRFQTPGPLHPHNLVVIHLPEQLRGACQTSPYLRQVMSLAEKMRQSKPNVQSRISEVNYLVIERINLSR